MRKNKDYLDQVLKGEQETQKEIIRNYMADQINDNLDQHMVVHVPFSQVSSYYKFFTDLYKIVKDNLISDGVEDTLLSREKIDGYKSLNRTIGVINIQFQSENLSERLKSDINRQVFSNKHNVDNPVIGQCFAVRTFHIITNCEHLRDPLEK